MSHRCGPESNINEGVLHTLQRSRTGLVGWLFLFISISTFTGLFNALGHLCKKQQWYYFTHSRRVFIPFPKICPKVNLIGKLKFKLAFYDAQAQHVSHYTMRTTLWYPEYCFFFQRSYSLEGDTVKVFCPIDRVCNREALS